MHAYRNFGRRVVRHFPYECHARQRLRLTKYLLCAIQRTRCSSTEAAECRAGRMCPGEKVYSLMRESGGA
jgi:hypothetical protein